MKILLLVLVVAGAGLVSLPWWLGALLRPVLGARGIAFERYERDGYSRFRLQGVSFATTSVELTAQQLTAPTPLVWAGRRLRGSDPVISVEGWEVRRRSSSAPQVGKKTVAGLPDLQRVFQRVGPKVAYWLPEAHFSNGKIQGYGPPVTIGRADWKNAALEVKALHVANQEIALALSPAPDGSLKLVAQAAANEARLELAWSGADVRGEAVLWGQKAQWSARFPAEGWLPAEASLTAENWQLPASRVKLGAPYARVLGTGRLRWRDGAFEGDIAARAEPAPAGKAPPFAANAAIKGNPREITVTALEVTAPFATATLSSPITFSTAHPPTGQSAELNLHADLAKMPWFQAKGRAEGRVIVAANSAATRQEFGINLADVSVHGFTLKSAQARGALHWPLLELNELKVQLDDTSSLDAKGGIDWRTREFAATTVKARLAPGWLKPWLPPGTSWNVAELSATVDGPLDAPRHRGAVKVDAVQRPPLKPVALDASWQGTGSRLDFSATARAAESSLEAAGTLDPHRVQLAKLVFSPQGQVAWELSSPASLTWSPTLEAGRFTATGPGGRLAFSGRGGREGIFEISADNFSSAWLQDWIPLSGPAWQLRSLRASGHVADRSLVFDATLAALIDMSPRAANVSLVARGDGHGIELKEFRVLEGERVLTQAAGRLPVSIVAAPAPHPLVDENAPLELTASTEPDSPLWATLTAFTGLQLEAPSAQASLRGTLRQPVGELQLSASRLNLAPGRLKFALPDFTELALALRFDRDAATLGGFSAKLDGQAVTATGRFPMGDAGWQQLWRAPKSLDWKKAEASVEIPQADLAPLARRFPALVTSQGRLRARVGLAPGGKISGELHLTGAASRPLPALGSLQDVTADLSLNDRVVTVQSLSATLGGEPVSLGGTVTLAPDGEPRLALALKGTNLPLVRNPGFLLRSDVDLRADTDDAGLTRLTGGLTIRDCLVLANLNLRTLLPGGPRGITRQPPYFAVPVDPFRAWSLAVDIRAPRAVRVRTTVYNGSASGLFHLGGTLGDPRAVGQLTVDQGQVLFPFATFQVHQGAVRLRESDPHRAVVNLNATSQRRDYQLRLEMTGELPTPIVTMTSTPALEAADVLLMVMTGQPPAGDTAAAKSSSQRFALLGAYFSRGLFQDLGFNGEDRLEISAGEHISRQGRETYEFEYKLGEHWSLTGEYDEFDAYNAGLRWRVYTEEGAPREQQK
ncbi:MAG TPA: translocation/assembly module TamB domain-containing protein [Lacunisphaera sp.]|nr:translocation/assembly module TamB domain-containing protein [Lacunisphaera sp.]